MISTSRTSDFQISGSAISSHKNIHLFDYLSEIHEQKSVILNTNLEFSQWVNILYDQRMTTALIGRLTHHVELILFPGINNRLRESSINETLSKISRQEAGNNVQK